MYKPNYSVESLLHKNNYNKEYDNNFLEYYSFDPKNPQKFFEDCVERYQIFSKNHTKEKNQRKKSGYWSRFAGIEYRIALNIINKTNHKEITCLLSSYAMDYVDGVCKSKFFYMYWLCLGSRKRYWDCVEKTCPSSFLCTYNYSSIIHSVRLKMFRNFIISKCRTHGFHSVWRWLPYLSYYKSCLGKKYVL